MYKPVKTYSLTRLSGFLFLLLFVVSCKAPRNNPLDPNNTGNSLFTILGTIRTSTAPPLPVAGASVFWNNENVYTKTDANGIFQLKVLVQKNGWLVVEKDGFSPDSAFVTWGTQKSFSVQKNLNAIPRLDSTLAYSIVKNKYSNVEYQLMFQAHITDDADVDSVFIQNDDLQIYTMLQKVSSKQFQGTFSDFELNLPSIDDVIGKDFGIVVIENTGKHFTIGTTNIKRIFKEEIEFISPSNDDTVSTTPTLSWKRFLPGFGFSYLLEVYTDEPEPKLVWWQDSISLDDISFFVDTPLNTSGTNSFFWVIWAIDEFQNRTRSKPASFIAVQQSKITRPGVSLWMKR